MTKAILSVRLETNIIEKFDAMAQFLGQTRSGLLSQILTDYAVRNHDALVAERVGASSEGDGGADGGPN